MSVVYYHYKATYAAPPYPSWNNTWPGYSGCSPRVLSLTQTNISQPPSPGSALYYNPTGLVSYLSSDQSGNSGMNPRGKPPFRFTNYRTGTVTRKEYLVITKWGTSGVNVWKQYGIVDKVSGSCTPQETRREQSGPMYSTYDEQTRDYSAYNVYSKSNIDEGSIQAELYSMRNDLIAEASTAYDVLTDISQLRDIPRTIGQVAGDLLRILGSLKSKFGRTVLRGAKSIRPLDLLKHPDKLFRMFGNEWMNYRYGIMPLVYSYRDIMKLMDRGQTVRTRKCRTINPTETGQSLPGPTVTYRLTDVAGSVSIRGEIFQYFSSAEVARLSGAGVNPLVTAWELIPYSFVIDWFVDIGSYIAASTCQSWAQTKYACLSTRRNYTRRTWVHLPNRDKTITVSDKLPTNWWGSAPPATPSVIIPNPEGLYLLDEEITNTYVRNVFTSLGVAPTFNPSLNWRRLVDGAVLILNNLGSFLRRL